MNSDPSLAKVKVDPHAKNQCRMSNDSAVRGRTDGRYQVHYLPRFAVDKNAGLRTKAALTQHLSLD